MSNAISAQIASPETGAEAPATATTETPAVVSTERPSWLPAKFKDVEQMAAAYAELEKKQSGGTSEETAAEAGTEVAAEEAVKETPSQSEVVDALKTAGLNVDTFTEEFAKDGKLSEESYKALAAKGYPKAMVDVYVNGLMAQSTAYEGTIHTAVGGAESYAEVTQWAAKSLPAAEIDAYNSIVNGGDATKAALAAAGLKAKMEAAFGKEPSLLGADSAKASNEAYGSWQEMQAEMRDPRYKTDPAFVKKVQDKAMRSSL